MAVISQRMIESRIETCLFMTLTSNISIVRSPACTAPKTCGLYLKSTKTYTIGLICEQFRSETAAGTGLWYGY